MSNKSAIAKVQNNLNELFQSNLAPGDAYIKFKITSDVTALLSMVRVQESLFIEARKITPLPSMPESVLGMMSSRDRVFCVFDLAQVLQLASRSTPPRQYQIIVLQTVSEQPVYFGLAVTQLQGIVRLSKQQIQTFLDGVPSHIVDYLSGVVREEETTMPILKLDLVIAALTNLR